jgi:hypothetical protein
MKNAPYSTFPIFPNCKAFTSIHPSWSQATHRGYPQNLPVDPVTHTLELRKVLSSV